MSFFSASAYIGVYSEADVWSLETSKGGTLLMVFGVVCLTYIYCVVCRKETVYAVIV